MPVVRPRPPRLDGLYFEDEEPAIEVPDENVGAPEANIDGPDVSIPTQIDAPVPLGGGVVVPPPSDPTVPEAPATTSTPEPTDVEPGPVPSYEDETPVLAPPPAPVVPPPATSSTFARGGRVNPALRTSSFGLNRVVGGGVDPFMSGFTNRFGPGVPTVAAPIPSGLSGDDTDSGALTDEELRRAIMGGRGRGR